jgi:hypothetical protein
MAESGLIWMWRETVEASATRLSIGSNTDSVGVSDPYSFDTDKDPDPAF